MLKWRCLPTRLNLSCCYYVQVRAIAKSAPKATASATSNLVHGVKGGQAVVLTGKRKMGSKGAGGASSKGDIMEQNEDGLEYSDEGEQEDLQQAMDSYSSATLGKVLIVKITI